VEIFERLAKEHADAPEMATNMLEWGRALLATGEVAQAEDILTKLAVSQEAQYWLAQAQVRERKWQDATNLLSSLGSNQKAADDLRAQAFYLLAMACDSMSNRNDAVAALSNGIVMARSPELKRKGNFDLGMLLLEAGRIDEGTSVIRAFVSAAPADPQSDAAQLKLAQALLDAAKYREAVDEFQGYLEVFTNSAGQAQAYYGRGWGLFNIGRYAEAATAFTKAYDLFADNGRKQECLFKVGDAYFANIQYKLAADVYERLLKEFPDTKLATRALFQIAESAARANEFDKAEKTLSDLIEKNYGLPAGEEALLRTAELKESRGRWVEAIDGFDRVMNTYSNGTFFADALHGRGLVRYRLFMFDVALADFDRVVRDCPKSAAYEQAFYMRGLCGYWMGRDEEAVSICTDFLTRFPNSKWAPEVLFCVGKQEYNQGSYDLAHTNFTAFVSTYPDNALADDALLRAGLAASKRKEYVAAVGIFARMAKEYPHSDKMAEARFAQADALCELADFSAAILICDEIINKYPESEWVIPAWGRKGDCQFGMGAENPKRYGESMESYRVVANSSTNNLNATLDLVLKAEYQIGACLEKLGKADPAFDQYYKVVIRYLDEREKGAWPSEAAKAWFTRAAEKASDITKAKQNWRSTVAILERVVKAGVPAAADAGEQIRKIKADHWWLFR
jgi:TolA-binding protein